MKSKKVNQDDFCVLTKDQMSKVKGGTDTYDTARPSKKTTVVFAGNKKQV